MERGDSPMIEKLFFLVDYPDLATLNATSGIGGLLSLPNDAYIYFWAWIIGAIWLIVTTSLYFSEKNSKGHGNILSSMSVSAFAILILSTIGTIVGFITLEIMTYILVVSFLIIGIWFLTGKR